MQWRPWRHLHLLPVDKFYKWNMKIVWILNSDDDDHTNFLIGWYLIFRFANTSLSESFYICIYSNIFLSFFFLLLHRNVFGTHSNVTRYKISRYGWVLWDRSEQWIWKNNGTILFIVENNERICRGEPNAFQFQFNWSDLKINVIETYFYSLIISSVEMNRWWIFSIKLFRAMSLLRLFDCDTVRRKPWMKYTRNCVPRQCP